MKITDVDIIGHLTSVDIEVIAAACHMANRSYCTGIGDGSQTSWHNAPEWQRVSARKGVLGALKGNTPEQSHESWLAEKVATGWVYGPVKLPDKKQHPCMVPYAELPNAQRMKDHVFVSTAIDMALLLLRERVVAPELAAALRAASR